MTEKLRYPTLKAAAQAALDVQDACNLSGVAIAFADVMRTLCAHVDASTGERNRHPIAVLWLDKMADLAGISRDVNHFGPAYEACKALAEDKT